MPGPRIAGAKRKNMEMKGEMFESFLNLDLLAMKGTSVLACDGEEIRRLEFGLTMIENEDAELVGELAEYAAVIRTIQNTWIKHYDLYLANKGVVDQLAGRAPGRPETEKLRSEARTLMAAKEVRVKYDPKAVHNARYRISYEATGYYQ